jgi:hypothetical protein
MTDQAQRLMLYMLAMQTLAKLDQADLDHTAHTLRVVAHAPALPMNLPRGAVFTMDPSKEVPHVTRLVS